MACGCGGSSSPLADSPVQNQVASDSENLWLGADAMPSPITDPPPARAVTGSLSISTGTAIALLLVLFIGVPFIRDLLSD